MITIEMIECLRFVGSRGIIIHPNDFQYFVSIDEATIVDTTYGRECQLRGLIAYRSTDIEEGSIIVF